MKRKKQMRNQQKRSLTKVTRKQQPKTIANVSTTWVTADDAKDDPSAKNTNSVMRNIEYILERMGLMSAYKAAVSAAGGDLCPWNERLKIASYVYFGGAQADGDSNLCVKKPMSMMSPTEIVDRVREIGIKKWGDVKTRPERRPLITEQTYKAWRSNLYPIPVKTKKADKTSFRDMCLDDRITWAHNYLAKYHALMAASEQGDIAVLKAMEQSCKMSGIPVFVGDERKTEYISFLVSEYSNCIHSDEIAKYLKELESPAPQPDIVHDARTTEIDYSKGLKLLIPTMKAMGLMDLYKEYSSLVREKIATQEAVKGYRNMAIAKYLITCAPMSRGLMVSSIPDCLLEAIDPQYGKDATSKDATAKDDAAMIGMSDDMWDREGGKTVNRIRETSLQVGILDGGKKSDTVENVVRTEMDVSLNGKIVGKIGVTKKGSIFDYEAIEKAAIMLASEEIDGRDIRKIRIVPMVLVDLFTDTAKRSSKKS
jgi:hypothetical protein